MVLASPRSRGSPRLADAVARRGLPVVAVPVGFAAWRLPPLADAYRPLVPAGTGGPRGLAGLVLVAGSPSFIGVDIGPLVLSLRETVLH